MSDPFANLTWNKGGSVVDDINSRISDTSLVRETYGPSLSESFDSLMGAMGWSMLGSAISGVASAIGQVWTGIIQNNMMKSRIDHQTKIASIQKDGAMETLAIADKAEDKLKVINTEHRPANAIARQASEGDKAVEEMRLAEAKKTEIAGHIDQAPLDQALQRSKRTAYPNGEPQSRAT
ncbi:MAG: hypothetical protein HY540_03040 [Deltaproteobacteria bacterium]|nr:hypothetical protein [Deltaproteobacteria bacterium]